MGLEMEAGSTRATLLHTVARAATVVNAATADPRRAEVGGQASLPAFGKNSCSPPTL
jgi:hypothetical protein